jgi:hypothetical protein
MKKIGYAALLLTVALSAQAGIYQAWEFNTPTDTEGWFGNGDVSGLTVQAAVSGAESVLTTSDITGNDPNVSFTTTQWTPDAGDTWSTFEMRFRLLDSNPGDAGVASRPYIPNGTLFFPNWRIYGGIDDATTDMTVVADGAGDWVLMTADISGWGAGTGRIDNFRIDPVGDDQSKNFEIDYMRVNVVPEPATFGLIGLFGSALLFVRRFMMV